MNGPHGLYLMRFMNLEECARLKRGLRLPLEVVEVIKDDSMDEGVRTVLFNITEKPDNKGAYVRVADAFCDFVECDYATRDAAAQWLLDFCNVRYGG